ncbi:single-stranded DNA-binding protein, partial [Caldisericum sp.]|uniref:single-stranded DNA-binding protein n=1 Tax=Caldisericum sp. TaxID=2499687 RepID=UPI003D1231D3
HNPEVRYIKENVAIVKFGIATNRKYKAGDSEKEETCFIDVVAFGKLAETIGEYLAKGMLVFISGRLVYRSWEDQEGNKKSKHEVLANTVKFIGSKNVDKLQQQEPSTVLEETIDEDDIPF